VDEVPNKSPFAEGLQDVVKERRWYFMGLSPSLQLAVEPDASFKTIRSLVCMALTAQTSGMLPTQSSEDNDNTAPPHVGGKFTPMDNEVSAKTLVKRLVTQHVNVMVEEIRSKNAAFTMMLGDWSEEKVSAAVRSFDDVHSNLCCASSPGVAWARRSKFWFDAMRGSEDPMVSNGGVPGTGTTVTLAL
jgi:hypothetical protein